STADHATISNSRNLEFYNTSTAGSAVITTTSGSTTTFHDNSDGGSAQFITESAGTVDFSHTSGPGGSLVITAGSISGAGKYHLGSSILAVGGNNSSTEVSGLIDGGGVIDKVGSGTLKLSHANDVLAVEISRGTLDVAAYAGAGS